MIICNLSISDLDQSFTLKMEEMSQIDILWGDDVSSDVDSQTKQTKYSVNII